MKPFMPSKLGGHCAVAAVARDILMDFQHNLASASPLEYFTIMGANSMYADCFCHGEHLKMGPLVNIFLKNIFY